MNICIILYSELSSMFGNHTLLSDSYSTINKNRITNLQEDLHCWSSSKFSANFACACLSAWSNNGRSTTNTISINMIEIGTHDGLNQPFWPHLKKKKEYNTSDQMRCKIILINQYFTILSKKMHYKLRIYNTFVRTYRCSAW